MRKDFTPIITSTTRRDARLGTEITQSRDIASHIDVCPFHLDVFPRLELLLSSIFLAFDHVG